MRGPHYTGSPCRLRAVSAAWRPTAPTSSAWSPSGATLWRVSSSGLNWTYLVDPKRREPGLFLQKVPDPTHGKNRWHLDLYAGDEEAEAARLESLGATRVRKFEKKEGDILGTVLIVTLDVEDNHFCVVRS